MSEDSLSPICGHRKLGSLSNRKEVGFEVRVQQGMRSAMVRATRSIEAQSVERPDSLCDSLHTRSP